ncbi:hypothetical protein JCM11491_002499 [Sporobolomyces phaffii]
MRTLLILPLVALLYPLSVAGSTSLVELLSASPDHSLLLRAFQRARLVPDLNKLNGSTLFAPTNEAIRRAASDDHLAHRSSPSSSSVWRVLALDSDDDEPRDNLQLELRQTLLYHCLNYTLFPDPNPSPTPSPNASSSFDRDPLPIDVVTLQETLYYPSLSPYNDSFPHPPTLPGSPPDDHDKPPRPPKGLLDGEGQKVRVVARKDKDQVWVGVDAKGEGGIAVNRRAIEWAKNGVFVPVDGVLERPTDLASIIRSTPSLSTFASLLPESLLTYLAETSHVTLFAPTNAAWDSLSELEMRYLRSAFSELDMREILQDSATRNAIPHAPSSDQTSAARSGRTGRVGYLERLTSKGGYIETLRNGTLHFELGGDEDGAKATVTVNGTAIESGDILASNGVLHTVPSLLLPSGGGSLALTAEKYLLALDCTKFVGLLHSVNLSHYVEIPSKKQDSNTAPLPDPLPHLDYEARQTVLSSSRDDDGEEEKGFTILALKDSLLSPSSSAAGPRLLTLPSFPQPGSAELADLLSYHILPSQLTPKKLRDGMLSGTELRPASLGHARQRLTISVQSEEGGEGEGWENRASKRGGGGKGGRRRENEVVIGFGNANAIAEPVEVGKSIIYLISTILEPPTSIISTAVSDLRLSTFIASVYSAHLDKHFVAHPAVSYLVPTNRAFERLGLVMSYLLLPTATQELESVIKYHAIDGLVYAEEGFPQLGQGAVKFETLQPGSDIYAERTSAPASGPGGGAGSRDDETNSTRSIVTVHGPRLARGAYPANGDLRPGRVFEFDTLTATGVYHVLDQVELPPTVEVTVDKLLKGAKSTTMVELIRHANLSWILEGKQGPDHDNGDDDEAEAGSMKHKKKKGAASAYTILCPTDKALSRLNLTYYLTHPDQLASLVKLHIIPTSTDSTLSSGPAEDGRGRSRDSNGNEDDGRTRRDDQEEEGTPLALTDSVTYPTLHSIERGGSSKYGRVAFRRWGTERGSWMVGIQGARGTKGESDSARVVNWGRATPWIVDGGQVAKGGGVILIDSVLLPWEPGWFRRWGWIALVAAGGVVVVALCGVWGVRKWRRRARKNGEGYQRVEGEED